MEALPDELLLAILGRVDDGRTLLDAVPLVCKRWHRLSREPEAWAGAVLQWESCRWSSVRVKPCEHPEAEHIEQLHSARALLHAPALRRLDMHGAWKGTCAIGIRLLQLALRQTSAAVREVYMPDSDHFFLCHIVSRPIARDFLVKSQRSLRALRLGEMTLWANDIGALSQLKWLVSLKLKVTPPPPPPSSWEELRRNSYGPPNLDPLRGALAKLECLDFTHNTGNPYSSDLLEALVVGATDTLRQLRFDKPSTPAVLAQVRRCPGLRELCCTFADVAVVTDLPLLRSLTVYAVFEDDAAIIARLASAADALTGCSLANLRRLHISVNLGTRRGEALWSAYLRLLGVFATEAPWLTALEIDYCSSVLRDEMVTVTTAHDMTVGGILERMRHLRTVTLRIGCVSDILVTLAALADLEAVNANVYCAEGRHYDYSEEGSDEVCRCDSAIADFKRLRPDVKTWLKKAGHLRRLLQRRTKAALLCQLNQASSKRNAL